MTIPCYKYKDLKNNIGEAWIVSDHPEGKSKIINGAFSGKFLSEMMQTHPEWFAQFNLKEFPLLIKLLDANNNLSVQVHPGDEYAVKTGSDANGKTECWYIIDAEPGSEIVKGHTAKNREEFLELSGKNKWHELLVRVPARAGDFFFIPSGAVHAVGKGIFLLEVQQNSDTTYRIYDYNRIGLNGRKRELHMEKAIEVIDFGTAYHRVEPRAIRENDLVKTELISCDYFTVEKYAFKNVHIMQSLNVFVLIYVINGNGWLMYDDELIHLGKGISIMIPAEMGDYKIYGSIEALLCHI